MTATPPKPRFALSIGVVGHRPNRLPAAALDTVRRGIDEMLGLVRQAAEASRARHAAVFSEEAPALTLISALAEGADRMAAESANAAGFALSAVLPFPAGDYRRDFADAASRAEFDALLAGAARVLTLPGDPAAEHRDYAPAGRTILDNADLVLAVWDGGPSAGRGGTTELVEEAVARDLPVIHVDATGQTPPRLLWSGLADFPVSGCRLQGAPSAAPAEAIDRVVEAITRPPADAAEEAKLRRYLAGRWRRLNLRIEVPLILAVLGLRRMRRSDLVSRTPAEIGDELAAPVAGGDAANRPALSALAAAFGAADARAVRDAQIFRGAYVSAFLFAALAVVTAALDLVGEPLFHWDTLPLAVLQMALILIVIVNTGIGRWRDWHGRWRNAREAAERLRAAVPLWLLGGTGDDFAVDEPIWPGWYARAHLRALGIWSGSLDAARLAAVRDMLTAFVDGQHAYHDRVAGMMRRVEHRLGRIAEILFVLTFLLGVLDLTMALVEVELWFDWRYPLIGLTASLPALGAAVLGIRLIGDFEGTARRSERSAAELAAVAAALRQDPAELEVLRFRAAALSEAMLADIARWRLATETRKLVNPV